MGIRESGAQVRRWRHRRGTHERNRRLPTPDPRRRHGDFAGRLKALRRLGGVATQRPAKPFTPVRFR